jgi:hypothetical protein
MFAINRRIKVKLKLNLQNRQRREIAKENSLVRFAPFCGQVEIL